MRGSLVMSLLTELKNTSGSTLSAPSASPVVFLKLRKRPFTVTMNCVGPTAPIVSGGTNPGVSEIVAPVKLVPTVCGVDGPVVAARGPPGSCDTSGEAGFSGSDRRKSASVSGFWCTGGRPDRSAIRCNRMRPATDSVLLGAPVIGVPCCQETCAAAGGADGADRMPTSETRTSPTSRQTIGATTSRSVVVRTRSKHHISSSGGIVIFREGFLEGGDRRVHTALHGPAGDALHLRDLPGRTLTDVRQLESRALTGWKPPHRVVRSLEEIPHLRAPLGSRLVGRFREPRQGGELASFQGSPAEEINREASSVEQDPRVERTAAGIEGRTGAHDLEERVLDQVFRIGLAAQEDQTQAVDAGCESIVESACRITLIAQERRPSGPPRLLSSPGPLAQGEMADRASSLMTGGFIAVAFPFADVVGIGIEATGAGDVSNR